MKTKATLWVGLLAALTLSAGGQSLSAVYLNTNPFQTVTGSFNSGATYGSVTSGVANFDVGTAFCVDPTQSLFVGETLLYTITPLSSLPRSASIAKIVGGYQASTKTSLDAAGAQWAIWEVLKDGTLSPSFASGTVRISNSSTNSVALRGMNFIQNMNSFQAAPLVYAVNANRQDMVFFGNLTKVPEPASASLGSLGAMLLVLRRRR